MFTSRVGVSVSVSVDAQNGYNEFTLLCSDRMTLAMTPENGSQVHSQASTLTLGVNRPLRFIYTDGKAMSFIISGNVQ